MIECAFSSSPCARVCGGCRAASLRILLWVSDGCSPSNANAPAVLELFRWPLGHGWHHSYDAGLYVAIADDALPYRASEGRWSRCPVLEVGRESSGDKRRTTIRCDSAARVSRRGLIAQRPIRRRSDPPRVGSEDPKCRARCSRERRSECMNRRTRWGVLASHTWSIECNGIALETAGDLTLKAQRQIGVDANADVRVQGEAIRMNSDD
jgi:hypothetical protein